jgi:hypothetical protein
MTDIEICDKILMDEIFKEDDIVFELELLKINDERLRKGLLVFCLGNHEDFKLDYKKTVKIMVHTCGFDKSDLKESEEYFREEIKKFRKTKPKTLGMYDLLKCQDFLLSTMNIENWESSEDIKNKALTLSNKAAIWIKDKLVGMECYEEAALITKWHNLK